MLDSMKRTIEKYQMLTPGDRVVVGCSGGADSVALLRGLLALREKYGLSIFAVHINHGLRGLAADADQTFTIALCNQWQIPMVVYQADVCGLAARESLTLEEAGRKLRYLYFEQAAAQYQGDKIAVAHHQNDNAETVLMNLCRGTGLKGLCGIPPVRGSIIRPLLETSRERIETFLAALKQPYRTDQSNYDVCFMRNRIRHKVIPTLIESGGKDIAAVITRTADLLCADEAFLSGAANDAYNEITQQDAEDVLWLSVENLKALPLALARRVIRKAFSQVMGSVIDISAEHTDRTLSLLKGSTGRTLELAQGLRVQRIYERIKIYNSHNIKAAPEGFCFTLVPDQPVYISKSGLCVVMSLKPTAMIEKDKKDGCTKEFRYDKIKTFLTLRTRLPGDFIYLEGLGRRKLQDYFVDRKMPRAKRDTLPLLAVDSEIIWIMDGNNRVNGKYKPEPGCASFWVTVTEENQTDPA